MKQLKARVYRNNHYKLGDKILDGYIIEMYDNQTDEWKLCNFVSILEGKIIPVGLMEILAYINQCGYIIQFK